MVKLETSDRKIMASTLKNSGYQVFFKADYENALEMLSKRPFHLVLVMIAADNDSGIQFVKNISRNHRAGTAAMPRIIGITTHEIVVSGLMDRCLVKPVSMDALLSAVDALLHRPDSQGKDTSRLDARTGVFNYAAALERAMDDMEFLEMILGEFIQDFPKKLKVVSDALKNSDTAKLAQSIYSLKGAASSVGAESLARITSDIEKKADLGEADAIPAMIEQLENEFLIFKTHILNMNWSRQ